MSYCTSKRFGSAVQLYHKSDGDRPIISLKPMDFEKLKQDKLKEGLQPAIVVRILETA